MNGRGKSDRPIVPRKPANKVEGEPLSAERAEGRGLTEGNPSRQTRDRTQGRGALQHALGRIRQAASKDRKQRFTALWHHVCRADRLREEYFNLKPGSAPGVDGVTWRKYGEDLGVIPESVEISFNGWRGFEIVVPLHVFGAKDAPGLMPLWRALAGKISREGIPGIDTSAFHPDKLLRLLNSVNSRTRLYKIPLEYKELRDYSAADILEMAKEPRKEDSLACPEESDRAAAWFREAIKAFGKRRTHPKSRGAGRRGRARRSS